MYGYLAATLRSRNSVLGNGRRPPTQRESAGGNTGISRYSTCAGFLVAQFYFLFSFFGLLSFLFSNGQLFFVPWLVLGRLHDFLSNVGAFFRGCWAILPNEFSILVLFGGIIFCDFLHRDKASAQFQRQRLVADLDSFETWMAREIRFWIKIVIGRNDVHQSTTHNECPCCYIQKISHDIRDGIWFRLWNMILSLFVRKWTNGRFRTSACTPRTGSNTIRRITNNCVIHGPIWQPKMAAVHGIVTSNKFRSGQIVLFEVAKYIIVFSGSPQNSNVNVCANTVSPP
mmetsp:Transcript_68/g.161  ORF Transcript_68/g.161 Transcript_68/m.161 type:complete len:285 (-) Transcript_68:74-928(-)